MQEKRRNPGGLVHGRRGEFMLALKHSGGSSGRQSAIARTQQGCANSERTDQPATGPDRGHGTADTACIRPGRRSVILVLALLFGMVGSHAAIAANGVCTVKLAGVSGLTSYAGLGFQRNLAANLHGTLNGQPDNQIGDFQAKIDWEGNGRFEPADLVLLGNGNFQVKGSHKYAQQGTYQVSVQATGPCGTTDGPRQTTTVTVSPMPSGIPGKPAAQAANAGAARDVTVNLAGVSGLVSFTGVGFRENLVASLHGTLNGQPDNNLGDYQAQVNWGDSDQWDTADLVPLGNGNFQVKGSHTYQQQGTAYPVVVYVNGADGTSTARHTSLVTVSPMPSGLPGAEPDSAEPSSQPSQVTVNLAGVSGFTTQATVGFQAKLVASFYGTLNQQPDRDVSHFHAQINWGDSSQWDSGQILSNNGSMTVYGTHTYQTQATYPVVVYVQGADGTSDSRATTTVTVTPAPAKPPETLPSNPSPDTNACTVCGCSADSTPVEAVQSYATGFLEGFGSCLGNVFTGPIMAITADTKDFIRFGRALSKGNTAAALKILEIKGQRNRGEFDAFIKSLNPNIYGASPFSAGIRDGSRFCQFGVVPGLAKAVHGVALPPTGRVLPQSGITVQLLRLTNASAKVAINKRPKSGSPIASVGYAFEIKKGGNLPYAYETLDAIPQVELDTAIAETAANSKRIVSVSNPSEIVSIKTLNMMLDTYRKPGGVFSTVGNSKLKSYIDSLSSFSEPRVCKGRIRIMAGPSTKRTLELGIPKNVTKAQWAELDEAAVYARQLGIDFRVTILKGVEGW